MVKIVLDDKEVHHASCKSFPRTFVSTGGRSIYRAVSTEEDRDVHWSEKDIYDFMSTNAVSRLRVPGVEPPRRKGLMRKGKRENLVILSWSVRR